MIDHRGVRFGRSHQLGEMLSIGGEIDMAVKAELDLELAALIAEHHATSRVDLSGVTFMDSTGTHSLLEAAAAGSAASSPLVLVAVSQPCRHVLEVSGVWGVLGGSES